MVVERMREAGSDVFFFVVLGVYIIIIHIYNHFCKHSRASINIQLSQSQHHKPIPASLGTP